MPEESYFAYIMASRSRTLYIGVTGNLFKRVFEHKWKEHDGFTEKYNCDRLVWFENYQDVTKAIAREKQLKGWRREKKTALIEKTNPAWVDMSKDWYDLNRRISNAPRIECCPEEATADPSTAPHYVRLRSG